MLNRGYAHSTIISSKYRYFLHAQYLKFHHPITGEQVNLKAALPSGTCPDTGIREVSGPLPDCR